VSGGYGRNIVHPDIRGSTEPMDENHIRSLIPFGPVAGLDVTDLDVFILWHCHITGIYCGIYWRGKTCAASDTGKISAREN
ncbi:MAG: hypothetical protein D4R93_05335, partial [Deltaproteobacteria bacterium]